MQQVSNTWVVSADGLKHKVDGFHLDTASARELGKRYAKDVLQLQKKRKQLKIYIQKHIVKITIVVIPIYRYKVSIDKKATK